MLVVLLIVLKKAFTNYLTMCHCLMYEMTIVTDGRSVSHSKPTVSLGNGTLSVGLDVGVGEGKQERCT